jgi:transposase-like protein
LKAAMNRSGEEWEAFLTELKDRGLDPASVNTDGGTGLLKGLLSVFENAVQMRDLFHVLQKLGKAKRAMEGICYSLIHAADKKSDDADEIHSKCSEAIAIFDLYENSLNTLQKACYLSHENGVWLLYTVDRTSRN